MRQAAALVTALALFSGPFAARVIAGPSYLTDDPEPVELRHWEVYAASQWSVTRGAANGTAPHVEVNYGALPELQLHVIVPAALAVKSGEPTRYGPGDVELGVKYRFLAAIRERAVVTFRGKAKCRSLAVMATVLLGVLTACSKRRTAPLPADSTPPSTVSGPSEGGVVAPAAHEISAEDRARTAQFGIRSPCVLHAGDSEATHSQKVTPNGGMVVTAGSCSFNAECIRQQGKDFAGDGDVELECRDRSCSCSYRRWSPGEKSFSFSFRVEEICSTADMAERLLRNDCLVGLKVDGSSGRTDALRHQ